MRVDLFQVSSVRDIKREWVWDGLLSTSAYVAYRATGTHIETLKCSGLPVHSHSSCAPLPLSLQVALSLGTPSVLAQPPGHQWSFALVTKSYLHYSGLILL
eukprot:1189837-Prorocentrum_minimum.AAC.3